MYTIEISTYDGDYQIREDELSSVTDEQLRLLRLSRAELHRLFAEGVRLMKERNIQPGDRIRPCADETLDGEWVVNLVKYSALSDPLMNIPPAGKG
jgi:hypothetical protein